MTSPNIKCTGWIERKELENYLASADIYLSTSLWEGLPLSVLEAMSIGLPVVLSDCVGNKDLVEDNGFLYSKKNEACNILKDLIKNNKKIIFYSDKSKKIFLRKFELKLMQKQYYFLYKNNKRKIDID